MSKEWQFKSKDKNLAKLSNYYRLVMDEYCDRHEQKDWPWRYSERPMVGMLSAAIWLAGGVTLEEYWTQKKHQKSKKYGRNDLYFMLGNEAYVVEAKHAYVNVADPNDEWDSSLRERATGSANQVSMESEEVRLAAAFWSFRLPPKKASKHSVDWARKFKDSNESFFCKKLPDSQVMVRTWYFPPWQQSGKQDTKDDYHYLGFAMELIGVKSA